MLKINDWWYQSNVVCIVNTLEGPEEEKHSLSDYRIKNKEFEFKNKYVLFWKEKNNLAFTYIELGKRHIVNFFQTI